MSSSYSYDDMPPENDPALDATRLFYGSEKSDIFDTQPPAPTLSELNSTTEIAVGSTLKDRFVLVESLGEGGMGVVFKALDKRKQEAEDDDPFVAVKVLRPQMSADPKLFIALQRETKRAQLLSHPNIIQVYDFDRDDQVVFMSMEYLTGKTLSKFIKAASPMSLDKAWPIIEGMGAALACAHNNNIVHSDFKPSNVFIKDGNTVKVLDFGIASKFNSANQEDAEKTRYNPRGLGALTEAYASLEMLEGNHGADPRDDIYAFGCVIYQLLTGKHPFSMLSAKQVQEFNLDPQNKNRKLLPAVIPGLSSRQMNALFKALQLPRAARTETVTELLNELKTPAGFRWELLALGLLGTAFAVGLIVWWLPAANLLTAQGPPPETAVQITAEPAAPTTSVAPADKPVVQAPAVPAPVSSAPVISLKASKPVYKIGQKLQLYFSVNKPLYVRIIHQGARGKTTDLLPNPFQPSRKLTPDKQYSVPPLGAKFSIYVEGPVGEDKITLLTSEQPISTKLNVFDKSGRLLQPLPDSVTASAQISYSVTK